MRAAVYHRFGGPEVVQIEQLPRPEPGATEVLIRVHATTVSAADYRSRSKSVPAGLALPSALVLGFVRPRRPILGMDVAGVIESVGAEVTRFAPGDEVIGMLGSRFGGHAEYALADESGALARKPRAASFAQAVALVFGGITARSFLRSAPLEPGARVLVNGASGSVGSAAVQLSKAAGANVTAVTSARNSGFIRALGADHTIDYLVEDFAAGTHQYDIVIDCVGNAPVSRVRQIVAPGGAVLLVAADLSSVVSAGWQSRRHGLTVTTEPGPYHCADLDYLVDLFDEGRFLPVIDRAYPLSRIADAHRYADAHHKRGNVVIDLTEQHRKEPTSCA
jgi:NADPH:quinone reductase-like Zn-dependent oxidoreductase